MNSAKKEKLVKIIVYKSNRYVYAQAFDFDEKKTVASNSSLKTKKMEPIDSAYQVGLNLGKKLIKIKAKFIFDRNKKAYHGQIKALAEGLRKSGIKI